MATFEREFRRLTNFDNLEKPVKQHLQNVYSTLSIALLASAAGAYIFMTYLHTAGLLILIGSIAMLGLLATTPHQPENQTKRLGYLIGLGLFTGMSLGPLIEMSIMIDPSIVMTALLGTSVVFICFSLSALLSSDRKFLYMGGFLFSGLSWLMILGVLNLFMGSQLIFRIELYLGLGIMCAFVLYDTQLIVEKRRRGDDDYIWHSVDLFIDFISIFRRLLIILSQKENDRKKRKD